MYLSIPTYNVFTCSYFSWICIEFGKEITFRFRWGGRTQIFLRQL